MTKIQTYSVKGNKLESLDFPKERTVVPNMSLISQAIYVFENRSHKGTSKTKTRAEVNATTAKMYKQKGTGNARHGARSAPLFAGGGTAHGPHGIKRILKISNNLKLRALNMALSMKVKEGKAVVVDKMETITKTKDAQTLLNSIFKELNIKKEAKILVTHSEGKNEINRAFRNIKGVTVDSFGNLNVYKVLFANLLVIDKEALKEDKSDKQSLASKAGKVTEVKTPKAELKKLPVKKEVKKTAKKVVKRSLLLRSKKGNKK